MLKVLLIIVCVLVVLFLISLVIYFFNLDMKLMVKIGPILNNHYDKIKRDRRL
jgi:flagellar basal body-associated protein FliL